VPAPEPRPAQLPEPEPENPANEPPEPEPPAPLLELPEQRRFVVPDFIGDGPTRKARVRAAEIEREGGAGRHAPPAQQRGGDQPSPTAPEPAAESFERAAEAALQSRHVPPAERPMVRRFFERLREAGG
jgi:hypothetical protein